MPNDRSSIATTVDLSPLDVSDVRTVQGLLDRMIGYTMLVHGVDRLQNGARDFLAVTPPGVSLSAKHAFAIFADREPVGLVDLIAGYPRPGACFIGLLAIVEGRRGEGLGRASYDRVEAFARDVLGAVAMRLAVIDSNPVRPFWRRMGFAETGEVRVFEGAATRGEAHMMDKPLPPQGPRSA